MLGLSVLTTLVLFGIVRECRTCRDDWVSFEESCYVFIDELVTWSTANIMCMTLRSRLVEVNTRAENDFLKSQLAARSTSSAWLGIQDFVREGTWILPSTLERATFFSWGSGEPNNQHTREGGEDCVAIYRDGHWDDYYCDYTNVHTVVCESPLEEEIVG